MVPSCLKLLYMIWYIPAQCIYTIIITYSYYTKHISNAFAPITTRKHSFLLFHCFGCDWKTHAPHLWHIHSPPYSRNAGHNVHKARGESATHSCANFPIPPRQTIRCNEYSHRRTAQKSVEIRPVLYVSLNTANAYIFCPRASAYLSF